jgi:hypothetical protein
MVRVAGRSDILANVGQPGQGLMTQRRKSDVSRLVGLEALMCPFDVRDRDLSALPLFNPDALRTTVRGRARTARKKLPKSGCRSPARYVGSGAARSPCIDEPTFAEYSTNAPTTSSVVHCFGCVNSGAG